MPNQHSAHYCEATTHAINLLWALAHLREPADQRRAWAYIGDALAWERRWHETRHLHGLHVDLVDDSPDNLPAPGAHFDP